MNERTNRTVICSIAFLDIVDYSKRVGQEQVVLKEAFNTLIAEVVKDIAPNDRVLIDTGDGAALCFMGDPENALFVVMNLRDRLRTPDNEVIGLTVRIGINLGPVRLIHDINDRQNVIGDGINVAQRVMSFAEPNQIMVSRSYYEIVSRLSQEYTRLFHYAGARTDKHVREHEVYEVGGGQEEPANVAVAPPAAPPLVAPPPAAASTGDTPRPEAAPPVAAPTVATAAPSTVAVPTRNKWLIPGAIVALIAVLAVGMFFGSILRPQKPGETAKAEAPAAKPADTATGQTVLSPPVTKAETEAKLPPPVVGATPGAKADGEAVSPPVAAAAPGTKADADTKVAATKANAPEPDPEKAAAAKAKALEVEAAKAAKAATAKAKASEVDAAKIAAEKGKAQEVNPAKAQPPVPVDSRKSEVAAAKKNEPRKDDAKPSGILEFWVSPWGDVFIDGARIGTSPPLKVYKLPAGSHRVEIYNDSAGFPFKTTVEVKADQVLRINQAFRDR